MNQSIDGGSLYRFTDRFRRLGFLFVVLEVSSLYRNNWEHVRAAIESVGIDSSSAALVSIERGEEEKNHNGSIQTIDLSQRERREFRIDFDFCWLPKIVASSRRPSRFWRK